MQPSTSAKILFVDDMEIMRSTMRRILILLDYKTAVFAANGLEALQMIQKAIKENEPFDMVITDVVMGKPEDGGLRLCEAINNLEKFKRPVVVVCSGLMTDEIMDSFRKTGVSLFFRKPFDIKKIQEFLDKILINHFEKKERKYEARDISKKIF